MVLDSGILCESQWCDKKGMIEASWLLNPTGSIFVVEQQGTSANIEP